MPLLDIHRVAPIGCPMKLPLRGLCLECLWRSLRPPQIHYSKARIDIQGAAGFSFNFTGSIVGFDPPFMPAGRPYGCISDSNSGMIAG
ncbi:MAG TPA: hypothetical protein VEP67_01555 [Thiobacillaceae bacterium]|nr:hypothetical protein [Thiobacillaceae bacterium]